MACANEFYNSSVFGTGIPNLPSGSTFCSQLWFLEGKSVTPFLAQYMLCIRPIIKIKTAIIKTINMRPGWRKTLFSLHHSPDKPIQQPVNSLSKLTLQVCTISVLALKDSAYYSANKHLMPKCYLCYYPRPYSQQKYLRPQATLNFYAKSVFPSR